MKNLVKNEFTIKRNTFTNLPYAVDLVQPSQQPMPGGQHLCPKLAVAFLFARVGQLLLVQRLLLAAVVPIVSHQRRFPLDVVVDDCVQFVLQLPDAAPDAFLLLEQDPAAKPSQLDLTPQFLGFEENFRLEGFAFLVQ